MNSRYYISQILYEVLFNKKLLNSELERTFTENELSDADKSFIKRETTGVIENISDIDKIINEFSNVKTKKLDKDILIALRIGVYEFLYMDKVPLYATINEVVDIVKHSKNSRLSGYVNAVLRNIERKKLNSKKTVYKGKKNIYRYFRTYDDSDNKVILELNDKNIIYSDYEGELDFRYAKVYSTNKYKDIIRTDSFRKGHILIEDASSIYLTDILADYIKKQIKPISNNIINILDTCSAPGTKIMGLIDLIKDDFTSIKAVARDISEDKIMKIKENSIRLSKSFVNIEKRDATIYNDVDRKMYDVVMCDVPCTGLGVIDKKPDIKLTYSEEKRDALTVIQQKILEVSRLYVKDGGLLVYSTCTETKEENHDMIDKFLSDNIDFTLAYEKQIYRGDKNNADGFYISVLKAK